MRTYLGSKSPAWSHLQRISYDKGVGIGQLAIHVVFTIP